MNGVASLFLASFAAFAGQAVPVADSAPRSLVMQYDDGATTTRLLRPRGAMWTPGLRRIPGADTTRDGQPAVALHVAHVVKGDDVVVTVGLAYGRPNNPPVLVATVTVSPGKPVVVDALREFGIEPVTFSIDNVVANMPYPPDVSCPTTMLDVRLEPVAANVPSYRVVIVNRSDTPLTSLRFEGYRGERPAISALKRGDRNYPLVDAKGTHTFAIDVSGSTRATEGGEAKWEGLDRFVITHVSWADGLTEGTPKYPDADRSVHTTRADHIPRLIQLLRNTTIGSPAGLRAAVSALGTTEAVRRQVEQALLSDLDEFEKDAATDPAAYATWAAKTAAEFDRWKARAQRDAR